MNEVIINELNYKKEILESKVPVIMDFWATWCGPCRMLAPELEDLAEKYAGKIKIAKVNVDENENLAARFEISSIPALFLVKNGEVVKSTVGFRAKEELETIFGLKSL